MRSSLLLIMFLLLTPVALAENDNTELEKQYFQAIKDGDTVKMAELLDKGVDINASIQQPGYGNRKFSGFEYAIYTNQIKSASFMLERGMKVNYVSSLNFAAYQGREEFIGVLLDKLKGQKNYSKYAGQALLAVASTQNYSGRLGEGASKESISLYEKGKLERKKKYSRIAKLLIDRGASLDETDEQDYDALARTVRVGNEMMVKVLVDSGAAIDKKYRIGLSKENTLMHIAAESGNIVVLQFLVDKGMSMYAKNDLGMSPLHSAAGYSGRVDAIKFFIEKGVPVDIKTDKGATPLMTASIWGDGNIKVKEYLIDKGADIEAWSKAEKNDYGSLYPYYAHYEDHGEGPGENMQIKSALLYYKKKLRSPKESMIDRYRGYYEFYTGGVNDYGGKDYAYRELMGYEYIGYAGDLEDIDDVFTSGLIAVKNQNAYDLLNGAVLSGRKDVIATIVKKYKVDINKSKDVMHFAVESGKRETVDLLIKDYELDIKKYNNLINTAIKYNKFDMLKALVEEYKVGFDSSDKFLKQSMSRPNQEMFEYLFKFDLGYYEYSEALHKALEADNKAMAKIFIEKGADINYVVLGERTLYSVYKGLVSYRIRDGKRRRNRNLAQEEKDLEFLKYLEEKGGKPVSWEKKRK